MIWGPLVVALSALAPAELDGALPSFEEAAATAAADYQGLPPDLRPHVLYLTTYNIQALDPKTDATAATDFWLNSLSSLTTIKRSIPVFADLPNAAPQKTPRLHRVDVRDYGWSSAAIQKTLSKYPYGLLTIPPVVRADWFLLESSDATRSTAYYDLLYPRGVPKNIEEFRKAWFVRLDDVRTAGIETGSIVLERKSIVALHNRVLSRSPTILGAYHQTFDAVATDPLTNRDYFRKPQGFAFDAQEHIVSMSNGLHAYFLSNAQGNRQEEAPTNIARNSRPALPGGDIRVITPFSCVECHGTQAGINIPRNALVEYLTGAPDPQRSLVLYAKGKAATQFIERFYLNDPKQRLLLRDQNDYSEALAKCNGLTPAENTKAFLNVLTIARQGVTIRIAAAELGTTEGNLKAALTPTAEGQLGALVTQPDHEIPREAWERAYYSQAYALLKIWKEKK